MQPNEGGRRRFGLLIGLAVLALVAGATAAVSIFKVGVLAGLALAGGGLVVYAVPAALLGWPLPTLEDVVVFVTDLVVVVVSGIVGFFRWLFD